MSSDFINLLNLLIPVVVFIIIKYSLGRKGWASFKKRDFVYLAVTLALIFFGTGMTDRNMSTFLVNCGWALLVLGCLDIL